MTPTTQTKLAPPDGNCMQACVAALFDLPLEDVPNFVEADEVVWNDEMGRWDSKVHRKIPLWWVELGEFAAARGYVTLDFHESQVSYTGMMEDTLAIAVIKSPRGPYNHCVVAEMIDNRVVMDPYPGSKQDRLLTADEVQGWTLFVKIGP